MGCGIQNRDLLVPLVEDGQPCGITYQGRFYQALRCPDCAYITFPAPEPALLDHFYEDVYPKGSASWYNVDSDYAPWKTDGRSSQVVRILERFGFEPGAILHEFGCAFGGTVQALCDRGYEASGTELNAEAVRQGRERGNTHIHAESALDYMRRQSPKVDVLYSFHAIEHFPDPFSFLQEAATLLNPNGLIVLFAPSATARLALVHGHLRYVWFGFPEHLHLFSPRSAMSLAEKVQCTVLAVETREFGIEPEITAKALGRPGEAAAILRAADETLLGEELAIVLTPKGSALESASAFSAGFAAGRSHGFAAVERQVMALLEKGAVDPAKG